MEEIELNALELLRNKEYDKAAKLYLQLAVAHPETEKFLVAAANCYDSVGDKKVALSLYKKALAINPQAFSVLLNLSTLYYEMGHFDKALEFAKQADGVNKNNFAVYLNIGNICYAIKDYERALSYYEKIYALNPNSANAVLNIANTCYNMGDFPRALKFAEEMIEKRPVMGDAYVIAGNALVELGKQEKALKYLKQALELLPASDWVCNSIANLFRAVGNWRQCLNYAWRAIALKGQRITADDLVNFAYLLYEAQDEKPDEAQTAMIGKYLERLSQAFPDNPIVHHTVCALNNIQAVPSMDLSYVRSIFDGFAGSFDEILRSLDYQVPQLIALSLKENLKTKLFKKRRILDLGCGTGLCAEEAKKFFPNEEFFGVDISEKMLEVAGNKNIYKELYADDIASFLEDCQEVYHAVIAGDVLTYIGDLKQLFRQLTRVVKFNGLVIFSISKNTFNNQDYYLVPSGRFVHTLGYAKRLLKYCGFKCLSATENILRHEGSHIVEGYVITAQKEIEVVFE